MHDEHHWFRISLLRANNQWRDFPSFPPSLPAGFSAGFSQVDDDNKCMCHNNRLLCVHWCKSEASVRLLIILFPQALSHGCDPAFPSHESLGRKIQPRFTSNRSVYIYMCVFFSFVNTLHLIDWLLRSAMRREVKNVQACTECACLYCVTAITSEL